MQRAFLEHSADSFVRTVNAFYMGAHIPCSLGFLIWAFIFHRGREYYLMRNGFVFAHILTVFIEAIFPAAPPRMLPEYGFIDTILVYTETHLKSVEDRMGVNPYAAMPSMHFQYAFVVGFWGAMLTKHLLAKSLFISYTVAVFLGVVVTGNHYVLDCLVAVLMLGIGHIIITNTSGLSQTFYTRMKSSRVWPIYLLAPFVFLFTITYCIASF